MRVRDLRQLIRLQPFERNAATRRLSHCHDVDDLRVAARRVLPKSVFDYVDGGADEEVSLSLTEIPSNGTDSYRVRWRMSPL